MLISIITNFYDNKAEYVIDKYFKTGSGKEF